MQQAFYSHSPMIGLLNVEIDMSRAREKKRDEKIVVCEFPMHKKFAFMISGTFL